MATNVSALEVASNVEWLPHAFEPDGQHLTAVFVPRELRAKFLFLTDRYFRTGIRKAILETNSLASACVSTPAVPMHFIFNTSFCCSTLLVKALEVPGFSATLKEPNILVNVAERLIGGASGSKAELELALRLLERPFAPEEKLIAKPSNFANRLVDPILEMRPGSRGILLYSDAGTFLRSIVKRGLPARINSRRLYQNLVEWTSLDFGFPDEELFQQTDLQIAALAWLMQIAHFQGVVDRWGPERVMLLEARDLLANPANVLDRIQSFFDLGIDDQQVAEIANGPAFSEHSKSPGSEYDQRSRDHDHAAIARIHAEELGMVLPWLDAVADHCGVTIPASGTS